MQRLAETCEKISGTTKKLEKTTIAADYFRSLPVGEAAVAAVFLSGRPFPVYEETTLQVGGSLLWQVVKELSNRSDDELSAAYRKRGDLGAVAGDVLPPRDQQHSPTLAEVESIFRQIAAARGPRGKGALVRELLQRSIPLEAKYLIKIMTGD